MKHLRTARDPSQAKEGLRWVSFTNSRQRGPLVVGRVGNVWYPVKRVFELRGGRHSRTLTAASMSRLFQTCTNKPADLCSGVLASVVCLQTLGANHPRPPPSRPFSARINRKKFFGTKVQDEDVPTRLSRASRSSMPVVVARSLFPLSVRVDPKA